MTTKSHASDIVWEGCRGIRWWIDQQREITGVVAADRILSPFPMAIFLPSRPVESTPVVVCVQGMSAPYGWNAFLVPTLLDMGIAAILIEAPLAAERSPARVFDGNVGVDIESIVKLGVPLDADFLRVLFRTMSSDIGMALRIARERHGVIDSRVALFGVSMGCLYTAHAFVYAGLGERLLGTIGHADMAAFARSYSPSMISGVWDPWIVDRTADLVTRAVGPQWGGLVRMSRLLALLTSKDLADIDPINKAHVVASHRRVRFLAGEMDRLVRPEDVHRVAAAFPDGIAYTVPGMHHGGPGFVDHVRYFIRTQLSDWSMR